MATWMTHLRIADHLLDKIPDISPVEFIMGNMAPDSGVPTPEGIGFIPSVQVSHFRDDDGTGKKRINIDSFREQYFTPELRRSYNPRQYAFYLGYLTHLIADCLWSDRVAGPMLETFSQELSPEFWQKVKDEWHHLDRLYLKAHPGFRAFRAYLGCVGFPNTFMEAFPVDAFENRRAYVTEFYLRECPDTNRTCRYLTAEALDSFVDTASEGIFQTLTEGGYL